MLCREFPPCRRVVCLILTVVTWGYPQGWAAALSTHTFGRWEIVLQEGTPVAMGEIFGTLRRQSGAPEYPLMLGRHKHLLELNVLGPGTRPHRLTASEFLWSTVARAGVPQFVLARTLREGEMLTMVLHHASLPAQVSLAVDLPKLERLLEGER